MKGFDNLLMYVGPGSHPENTIVVPKVKRKLARRKSSSQGIKQPISLLLPQYVGPVYGD